MFNRKNSLDSNNTSFSRYCNQNLFDIMFCEWEYSANNKHIILKTINGGNLKTARTNSKVEQKTFYFIIETVYLKGEIYVLGTDYAFSNNIIIVKKYRADSKLWEHVFDFDNRRDFCVSALINSIYIIGGFYSNALDSCLLYNTKSSNVKGAGRMNTARYRAACAVFEGKIVVSGGYVQARNYDFGRVFNFTNSVEAYDHTTDTWSNMPNMVEGTYDHSLVAIKDKLYVIGFSCEIYDSLSKKFVLINKPSLGSSLYIGQKNRAVSIANKIFVFRRNESKVTSYNVDTREWTEEDCDVTDSIKTECCVKIPQYD